MRTYLQAREIDHPSGRKSLDLVLVCTCGTEKRLAEWYEPPVRPWQVDSLNTHLVMQRVAEFNYEHSDCRNDTRFPRPSDAATVTKP